MFEQFWAKLKVKIDRLYEVFNSSWNNECMLRVSLIEKASSVTVLSTVDKIKSLMNRSRKRMTSLEESRKKIIAVCIKKFDLNDEKPFAFNMQDDLQSKLKNYILQIGKIQQVIQNELKILSELNCLVMIIDDIRKEKQKTEAKGYLDVKPLSCNIHPNSAESILENSQLVSLQDNNDETFVEFNVMPVYIIYFIRDSTQSLNTNDIRLFCTLKLPKTASLKHCKKFLSGN